MLWPKRRTGELPYVYRGMARLTALEFLLKQQGGEHENAILSPHAAV